MIVAGLVVYLEKDYATDGKTERYARGIIKNHKPTTRKPNGRTYGRARDLVI